MLLVVPKARIDQSGVVDKRRADGQARIPMGRGTDRKLQLFACTRYQLSASVWIPSPPTPLKLRSGSQMAMRRTTD